MPEAPFRTAELLRWSGQRVAVKCEGTRLVGRADTVLEEESSAERKADAGHVARRGRERRCVTTAGLAVPVTPRLRGIYARCHCECAVRERSECSASPPGTSGEPFDAFARM